MVTFPGAGAQVYYNEAGEPTGWDYPSDEPYEDLDDFCDDEDGGWVQDDEDLPRWTYIRHPEYPGVALWVMETEFAGEQVHARMVGDDHTLTLWRDDIVKLNREEFCGECGQIGCSHDGLERDA